MTLSLSQVATVLGKSERQVRYLIKTGRLRGVKEQGRWRIDSADLPLNDAQREAVAARIGAARQAFEKGVETGERVTGGKEEAKPHSVTDYQVFQSGEAIYRDAQARLGPDDDACRHLFAALTLVTRGCHSFHPNDKAKQFGDARQEAATATTHLLLQGEAGDEERRELVERIEGDLIPKLARMVAGQEKRSRRGRFDRFGSYSPRDRSPSG